MTRELLIQCPDGEIRTILLAGKRFTIGRSASTDMCFPDDTLMSRHHLAFEAEGEEWAVQDLGSTNGTFVNGAKIDQRVVLKPGDRVAAGHLGAVYAPEPAGPVVVFEGLDAPTPAIPPIVTSLAGALANQTIVWERGGPEAAAPMRALLHAGMELSQNRPLGELLPVILDLAIEAVKAERGVLLIMEGDTLVPKASRGAGLRISTAVRDCVMNEKTSILVCNVQLDDVYKSRKSIVEQKVHSMMAVPLQSKGGVIGLIYVDSPLEVREFTEDDLNLLTVMANVAAVRIENVRLAELEEADRIMQRDLTQAAAIQRRMLPDKAPVVAGAELAGFNAACRTVGGDYYGFFTYPDGRVSIALGDVCGKGMPAALMATALQSRVQVLAEESDDPGIFMQRLNKATCVTCPPNLFITFFYCLMDGNTGDLVFANAGHSRPFIVRATGESESLNLGGPVLGILPSASYSEGEAALGKGDVLALYSDGVTEARNAAYEEFGEQRFLDTLREHRNENATGIVKAVVQAVTEFAAGYPQADDITMVVVKKVT